MSFISVDRRLGRLVFSGCFVPAYVYPFSPLFVRLAGMHGYALIPTIHIHYTLGALAGGKRLSHFVQYITSLVPKTSFLHTS